MLVGIECRVRGGVCFIKIQEIEEGACKPYGYSYFFFFFLFLVDGFASGLGCGLGQCRVLVQLG